MANSREQMQRDWDERAQRDAFHYIASWREDWDEATFFESGEQDYLRLVDPILQKLGFDPAGKGMVELGCGVGRMTRSFAKRFGSVYAVDISAEMQARGKEYQRSFANIRWILSDGETLAGIEAGVADFVFSYLVLQHMPKPEVVAAAIREMLRVLAPGGAFLFQFNGSRQPTMNWKGRLISGVLDGMSSMGLKSAAQSVGRLAGIDPGMVGKTWRGVALTSGEIDEFVRAAGGSPAGFLQTDTPMAWCYGHKEP